MCTTFLHHLSPPFSIRRRFFLRNESKFRFIVKLYFTYHCLPYKYKYMNNKYIHIDKYTYIFICIHEYTLKQRTYASTHAYVHRKRNIVRRYAYVSFQLKNTRTCAHVSRKRSSEKRLKVHQKPTRREKKNKINLRIRESDWKHVLKL